MIVGFLIGAKVFYFNFNFFIDKPYLLNRKTNEYNLNNIKKHKNNKRQEITRDESHQTRKRQKNNKKINK